MDNSGRLKDREIGPMWTHHFRARKENGFSWNICLNIADLIKARARYLGKDLNFPDRFDEILGSLHIPSDEFSAFEKESESYSDLNRYQANYEGRGPGGPLCPFLPATIPP
jgi:hypothetical protein